MNDYPDRPRPGGVILCRCRGHIDEDLALEEVASFLCRQQPNMPVAIADDLCQPGVLQRFIEASQMLPVVVGACAKPEFQSSLQEGIRRFELDRYALRTVDLLAEVEAHRSRTEATERAKLLLWAQVKRAGVFEGVGPENLSLHFGSARGSLSRRQLLRFVVPQYKVVPSIEAELCVGCGLCLEACPQQAIAPDTGIIDKDRCQSCGTCIAVCPLSAVCHPLFSWEQLDAEMAGLLTPETGGLTPKVIAFACQRCLPESEGDGTTVSWPGMVFPVEVPCLAVVSPRLLLRALDLGTWGVALVRAAGECPVGPCDERWQGGVEFVQQLLTCWGIEPQRIAGFELLDGGQGLVQQLTNHARTISGLGPCAIGQGASSSLAEAQFPLPSLIASIHRELDRSPGAIIAGATVPLGRPLLASERCTSCGLCAQNCPTDALTALRDEAVFQLFLQHERCVACEACVRCCPEKCLRLERVLELDRLGEPPVLFYEDQMLRCQECGQLIAPKAMIEKLRQKLAGLAPTPHLDSGLCTACTIKGQFSVHREIATN